MYKRLLIFTLILIQIILLYGCNLPNNKISSTKTPPSDLVYTVAAETVEAHLSPTTVLVEIDPVFTSVPETLTPIPTLEPTQSSTPTESPTSTDIPEVIFFDDFSDTSSWYVYEDDRYGFYYSDDGYHIYNNVKLGLIWSIRDQQYTGVALEVDGTRLEGPEDSYFGVICKFSDKGENYYALVVSDSGFYGFGLMEDGEFEFVETGIDELGVINRGLGETNRIRGICNDNHFLIYANNELLLDIWDDTHEVGIIGLVVGNQRSESGAEYRFNDFAITWP